MTAGQALFELALASINAAGGYMQKIREAEEKGVEITWQDVDEAIARSDALRTEFEKNRLG